MLSHSRPLLLWRSMSLIQRFLAQNKYHTTSFLGQAVPKNLKGKSTSSQQWLTRHLNDPYVARALKMGYRARSAFKLIELNDKFKLFRPGQWLVDCGAAPGAWTQVAVPRINSDGKLRLQPKGKIVSIDLLPIEPIPGAILLPNQDFTDEKARERIIETMRTAQEEEAEEGGTIPMDEKLFDGILSDMAPNATGFSEADHYRILSLVRVALAFAGENGKKKSFFVGKLWDGPDTGLLCEDLEKLYKVVKLFKPPSSRAGSAEVFVVAKFKKD